MPDDLLKALAARHCQRAFLAAAVPRTVLEEVLAAAANAPSTRNGQPWQVAVVTGAARDALAAELCARFDRGEPPRPDYASRPPQLPAISEERAAAVGAGVLRAKGVARDDAAARRAHLRDNLRFYGAPVEMIFHLAAAAAPGTFLEMGLFLANVLLGLSARGLGSCPQASVAGYPDAIRSRLALAADRLIVCGLAVGYPDPAAPVNGFAPERAGLASYTQWLDDVLS